MLNKIRLSIAYLNYCAKGTLTEQRNSILNWQWGIASPHRPHQYNAGLTPNESEY